MFCNKCGNKLPEDSGFCPKCGTKIVSADTIQQTSDMSAPTTQPGAINIAEPSHPATTSVQASIPTANENDFKAFIDNHVRMNTKYQSAEDLLKKSKPLAFFLSMCFGIPTIIGLVAAGPIGALLFGIFFGHVARFIAGGIIRFRYSYKTSGKFDRSIDTDELIRFFNERLGYLSPYFHEWKPISAGTIGASFGIKQRSTALISIIPDKESPGSKGVEYIFNAKNNPSTSILSKIIGQTFFSLFQIGEPQHDCLFKSVPILRAAMEYYLKYQNS